MNCIHLGRSGLKVSQLCLGTWHLPRSREKDQYNIFKVDKEETKKVIKLAFECGLNFIDTANIYHGALDPFDEPHFKNSFKILGEPFPHFGNAEKILGEILCDYQRESYVISTKVRWKMAPWPNGEGLSRKHIFWQINESLERLRLRYVDVYLLHKPDKETPFAETLIALDDLVHSGKVHYIGSSNFSSEEIIDCMECSSEYKISRFITLQEPYNLMDRGVERDKAMLARKYGLAIMAYSPLAQGLLSDKYLNGIRPGTRASYQRGFANMISDKNLNIVKSLNEFAKEIDLSLSQMALAWILNKQKSLETTIIPVIGVSSCQQLIEILQSLDVKISEGDMKHIETLAAGFLQT